MNKQDFFRKGVAHAQWFHDQGKIIPPRAYPVVSLDGRWAIALSGSWQAMAYKYGFNSNRQA